MGNEKEISDRGCVDNLAALIKQRGYIKGRVTRLKNFMDTFDPSTKPISVLNVRLEKLNDCWREFNEINMQIKLLSDDDTHELDQIEFENNYYEVRDLVEELIHNETKLNNSLPTARGINHSSDEGSTEIPPKIKLPEIPLPKFSGKFDEWLDFYHIYLDIIHNSKSVKPVHKFYYLRSCLEGDALKVIQEIKATPENYDAAWNLVKRRFHNKRLIIRAHIQAILDIKPILKPSVSGLRQMYDTINNRLTALKNIGEPIEYWGTILESILVKKLDNNTRNNWEIFVVKQEGLSPIDDSSDDLRTQPHSSSLETFMNFLNRQCRIQEALEENKNEHYSTKNIITPKKNYSRNISTALVASNEKCLLCKDKHSLSNCENFGSLTASERINKVREFKLCLNCLRQNHKSINCKSPYTCKFCHKKHHSLLHINKSINESNSTPSPAKDQNKEVIAAHSIANQETLLATAIIKIADSGGKLFDCRALLDSGSQSNFIKQSLAATLGLKQSRTNISISGIDGRHSEVKFMVRTVIKSAVSNYEEELDLLILKRITGELPACSNTNFNLPEGIKLADEKWSKARNVDILLGAEVFYDILLNEQIKLGLERPILQNTVLGWVIGGKLSSANSTDLVRKALLTTKVSTSEKLDDLIASFWQVEEISKEITPSKDEKECEEHFLNTVKRMENGRYVVSLPFSQDPKTLGISRPQAVKRFRALEKRLNGDNKLKEDYTDFLNQYLENDEMELVSDANETDNYYYLPHHPVIKDSSSTTRVRVVFDASAKTSSGKSLNDLLMIGPTIQRDLFSILLSFRFHRYVFTSDIKQMYRRILIEESQQDYQRILWRENPTDPIQTYRLKTVTYGTASAPYLAIRTLFKLADDEEHNFPLAAPVLRKDFYVDDVLTGGDDLEEVKVMQRQLIDVLASGQFELRKWCANHSALTEHLPQEHLEADFSLNELDKTVKTLGIHWQPAQDSFGFKVSIKEPPAVSKRSILADVSRLFDPIGLISPVIVTAKLFMQEIWREKNLQWDEAPPEEIINRWIQYRKGLDSLSNLMIKRRAVWGSPSLKREIQIHGFCDASIKAYGAAIYIRTKEANGNISVSLLCSKSRVAPLKTLSLPRLELCGALLLAQLYGKCQPSLKQLNITNITLWTDSTIVLHWLNASANTWQTFVANRVSQIQALTADCKWRHVPGKQNPADLITRSVPPEAMSTCLLWWNGPEWLALNDQDWPESILTTTFDPLIEERRKTLSVNVTLNEDDHDITKLYSDWEKLLRIVALCKRFVHNCRHPQEKHNGPLEPDDYVQAEYTIIKKIQERIFESDIKKLRKNHMVSNQLRPLSPFLDDYGIIRVGGRLRHANVEPNHKNQILLPKNHHVTQLIFKYTHLKTCHGGPQLLLATIRTKYWPLNGRIVARSTVHKCIQCCKAKPTAFKHLMGDLPHYRVQPAEPFNHCGIDYCGPIYYRRVLQRRSAPVKGYVALFICMVTKAVHLELVPDLTSKKFLNALQRVLARRGRIQFLYSDNATNFIGANNEMKELNQALLDNKDDIECFCASEGIKWAFIPPRSPHFGGLWESGIKLVKGHLKRVIGRQILAFDELETLLILIESCVNSRPLTISSEDPNDFQPLTPAHFLIGRPLSTLPVPNLTNVSSNRLNRWQLIQQLHQSFWKRWKNEYLATLQRRVKWTKDHPDPKVGTVVIIKDEARAPLFWDLGRIVAVHPGADGRTRVATVKTGKGDIKRCITKLCPLLDEE